MPEPDARATATLRAAVEVFVPGPPFDGTPGAADVGAERFVSHYLDVVLPGLATGLPDLLDHTARSRYEDRPFADLTLEEREAVLDALAEHEMEQLRDVPALIGLLAIAAVYGEWSGTDEDGELVREPLGWELTAFDGPVHGRPHLLR